VQFFSLRIELRRSWPDEYVFSRRVLSMQRPDRDAYVQYGCGFCAPATWRNFDASPTLRFAAHTPYRLAVFEECVARPCQRRVRGHRQGVACRRWPLQGRLLQSRSRAFVAGRIPPGIAQYPRAATGRWDLPAGDAGLRRMREGLHVEPGCRGGDQVHVFFGPRYRDPSALTREPCCPHCSDMSGTTGCGTSRPPGSSLKAVASRKSTGPVQRLVRNAVCGRRRGGPLGQLPRYRLPEMNRTRLPALQGPRAR